MLETHKDEIDAETVIARIRENLRSRVSGGVELNDQGPPAGLPAESLSISSGTVGHHMNLLRLLQDPKPQGPIASDGIRLIEQAKRFIRRILASYHRGIFARQAEFNTNLVALMAELLQTLEKSRSNHGALLGGIQAKIETLQAEQAQALTALTTRLETLQAEHERMTVQIESQVAGVTNRLADQYRTSEDLAAKHTYLGRRFEEQRQEMILQKRRLELILSELRKKIGGKRESLSKVASQKERLMDHSYFLFENRHRGSLEEIKKRQEIYLPIFEERTATSPSTVGTAPSVVLDIGCGRGEFLELLRERGIPAKGIDLNEDMVHVCRERGLDVEQTNALVYLEGQPDESLAGVISCQVIEHLPTTEMIELLKLCYQKLEKGGRAVFETVNPLSLLVSATNFYLDLSHIRQVHPMALQFLAEAIGFINAEIKFLAPYPDELKLQLLSNNDPDVQKLNQNFTRLNDILFGFQDYAVICEK